MLITNTEWADIDNGTVSLDQTDKNYDIMNQYTIRFKPTNPINDIGAVMIEYPKNIGIESVPEF